MNGSTSWEGGPCLEQRVKLLSDRERYLPGSRLESQLESGAGSGLESQLDSGLESGAQSSWERERLLEALEAFDRGRGEAAPAAQVARRGLSRRSRGLQNNLGASPGSSLQNDLGSRWASCSPPTRWTGTETLSRPAGWDLAAYRSNPVFLWAHDYARPVIGRAVDTWLEPHRLLARMEFAATPFALEVAGLYRAGYQSGACRWGSGPCATGSGATRRPGRCWASASWSRNCWR